LAMTIVDEKIPNRESSLALLERPRLRARQYGTDETSEPNSLLVLVGGLCIVTVLGHSKSPSRERRTIGGHFQQSITDH